MPVSQIEIVSADPAAAASRELVEAMEDEIEEIYSDRAGSIHDLTADADEMRPPNGGFVVVRIDGEPAAGGGFKRIGEGICEIKRMYVAPAARGLGIGGELLRGIERAAREAGYGIARLDTGDRQPAASRLYLGSGYRPIPDYNGNRVARHWFEKEL